MTDYLDAVNNFLRRYPAAAGIENGKKALMLPE